MDRDANISVQHELRLHHKPLRFCGLSFFSIAQVEVLGKAGKNLEGAGHPSASFAQDNLFTPAENFHFFAFEAEFLGQSNSLAVSGLENSSCGHRGLRHGIYSQYIRFCDFTPRRNEVPSNYATSWPFL
ncbi:MAG TPA: hypothetical protein VFP96_07670 [Candidatus Acidoferrum sp.]|nr:hypothetical protein [Candidatus Acidoferrum sp.]